MGDVDLVWYLKEEEADTKFILTNEKHRVPLERLEYTLRRETEPLRHIISTATDWASIMSRHLKFLEIVDAISIYMTAHPNQKVGLNTTTKEDKAPDMAKPESEVNQQEEGDPYPQDSTELALDIQKQQKLRKTNIPYTPPNEKIQRTVYEQRKTGKLYIGNGEPYTGFSDNIGPDLSTSVAN